MLFSYIKSLHLISDLVGVLLILVILPEVVLEGVTQLLPLPLHHFPNLRETHPPSGVGRSGWWRRLGVRHRVSRRHPRKSNGGTFGDVVRVAPAPPALRAAAVRDRHGAGCSVAALLAI